MSDFENEKLKMQALDLDIEDDEDEEEEEEVEEIQIDTGLFAEQVIRFPCFREIPQQLKNDELFDLVFNAYQDENLTEEQDHVVELLLHLQEEDSPFNLSRALEVWSNDNRLVFLELIQELNGTLDEEDDTPGQN